MKISQSNIALHSQHTSALYRSSETKLRTWVGDRRPDFEGREQPRGPASGVVLGLSPAASIQMAAYAKAPAPTAHTEAVAAGSDETPIDPRLRLLMDIVLALTGRAVHVFDARELQAGAAPSPVLAASAEAVAQRPEPRNGWGFEFDAHEIMVETESTMVSAQGVVQTVDGKTINFTLQLAMARTYTEESRVSVRAGDAVLKDPLVINFNGAGAELSDMGFTFDLDADGSQEQIAFVGGGSGFLILDRNGDGQVNDGSELFGVQSGDGFVDLAQYDLDDNQWIDENDAVYRDLQVWQKDDEGQDSLRSLAQSGVGALYLGRVASPFSVNTATNQSLGLVRSTGIFLYETGQVGSLQQVDLALQSVTA